ncbi:MEP1A protein, partial [Acromyrmex heyeri]
MQLKAQCLRGLFSLTLVLLLHSWFVTNVNAYPVQLINPWIIGPLQILRKHSGHSIHEILHTLGVYHEHMRPDRDEYINIIWENMRKEDEFNFELLNNSIVTNYGLLYDYDSTMHYSMIAFSTNRSLPTIIPKKNIASAYGAPAPMRLFLLGEARKGENASQRIELEGKGECEGG